MTWLELLQQDPAAFVLNLIVSLVITLVAYGAFPLIFARMREETITKKKYNLFCFGINFLVMVVFIAINGEATSAGPYMLWTLVFSTLGIKTLKNRGVLEGFSSFTASAHNQKILFCRHCGSRTMDGSLFCNHCGTKLNWK